MQIKKENILDKIVKRNYNNELEKILEEKNFSEDAKNILLSIFYKIETSYKDVEIVKRNIEIKEEFIENIINIIKYECNEIEIVKINDKSNKIPKDKTYLIKKEDKKIITYPIERKILYAIAKISNKETILRDKYYLLNDTISSLINIGKNIEIVETIRDFNGFSWTTIKQEIESIDYNLIYQNLRILVGFKFLNNWIKNDEFIIDYFELLKNKLDTEYGEKLSKKILNLICEISVLLEAKFNPSIKEKYKNDLQEIEEKILNLDDREKFVEQITKQKAEINKQIKQIDTTLSNKQKLEEEYVKRNEKLSLDKKIFSIKVLTNIMKQEREKKLEQIEKLNQVIKPKGFIKYKEEIEEKYKYLKLIKTEKIEEQINKKKIELQIVFLECFKEKIKNANQNKDITDLIYQYRYYINLVFDNDIEIRNLEKLKKLINEVEKDLIKKANEQKIIQKISNDENTNYNILKNLFNTRLIKLEDINFKITKEKDKYYLHIMDENVFEKKVEIESPKDLEIKLNKDIPLW